MGQILNLKNIIIYILAINIVTLLAMYIDKQKAKRGNWRIKESTLFTLVLLGGGIGGMLGMKLFRHKTKKTSFIIGFPAILILEVICIVIYFLIK